MPAARSPLPAPGADPGRRRVLAALLGAPVLATGGLTGCSDEQAAPAETGPIELSVFWYGGTKRAELTERALRLYSDRNPRVSFRVTWQGANGYYERLATQAAGGNVPDLIQLDDSVLTEYAQREILLDLSGYVADNRLDLRALPPALARYGQVDGRTVGVPAAQTVATLVYDRGLLRRLRVPEPRTGMSWPEYISWAQRVTRASESRVAGTMDPSGDYRALWLWLRGRGGELYRGRQLGFDPDVLVEWFELWQRARAGRATPSAALVDQADGGEPARQLVVTGASAASFAWSHQFPELQRLTGADLGLAALPGPLAAHWPRASMYWAAFRGTRHPGVVIDVINFLTGNGEAGTVLGHERGFSASLAVRRYVEGSITDEAQKRAAAFGATLGDNLGPAPSPPPKGHSRVRELLLAAAESIRSGEAGTRAATTRFMARADAALAE
ncbi:ABC transporter substrate-binding protein [Micromonospora phytophila]|uniref:ABC transporter substrate-binding protein n=1 Tax=Micromonospora phytophila TaxID=709888 RepID=UPI00202FB809|nr:ABC transporter substrate-binding protein [Micromonospora phytophila]MCM0676334.1 ABC transporter substrate-binding protein [Micromonospora phytophila]